jgi:cyclic pyranopterin monophosphate synthase
MQSQKFSHLDDAGNARMVNVGGKPVTHRTARAAATVQMSPIVANQIRGGPTPKGDVLQVARVAAIVAAKRTDELIPLCHTLPLDQVVVDFQWQSETRLHILVSAAATARTGVEMEALVGASVAALTVYDMCKSLDKGISIEHIRLVAKSGGSSGDYQRAEEREDGTGS